MGNMNKASTKDVRPTMPVDVLLSGGLDSAAVMAFYLRQDFDV